MKDLRIHSRKAGCHSWRVSKKEVAIKTAIAILSGEEAGLNKNITKHQKIS